ncbi:YhcH/YjgK/YiaL family protein [Paenibacillus sp. HN-1]|uniref:YhcH/YjgK/YiaL family protein n=1 Tax=Paenibacillus TaxID=44249 RepID=UPI001CA941B9|nr:MULTISPECIES: YhcH/YjgK/YiaL family protein [Paenibacillus]MBY9078619.1 YhcH/YjgK/YiaL family protein [Paenibacillus sp. CGMCC 1.18879]MBY9084155.1 YhcH/YjgK/YiaL family protein [Paenibacillus sinensis]
MILGSLSALKDSGIYGNSMVSEALKALQAIVSAPVSAGRIEVQEDRMYVNIMEPEIKPADIQPAEKHEAYADIHYLFEGEEVIGWSPLREGLQPLDPYHEDEDYALYSPEEDEVLLSMRPGMFAIFFPEDIHRPCLGPQSGRKIKKAVMKVHMDLFKTE